MEITRTSIISKETRTRELDVTQEQLSRIENSYITKELIQNIVPHLSIHDREFIMTGITEEEWKETFGE